MTTPKALGRSAISRVRRSTGFRSDSTPLGESPPPPLGPCFGRDELIEGIIGFAENCTPIALIGAGGIGKTSVALAVLHHDRIVERFGDNRRFIRCDQFPASHASFLRRLSTVIGAGVENPEDLTPLRASLSSKEMVIVLDNAESILDPRGANAQEIFAVVEELSQFRNICLCITSRVTAIPSGYRCLDVPTLSRDVARGAFYRIYGGGDRPDLINNILEQLDFNPLSVTLLATAAYQNKWDNAQLAKEWEQRQTGVLQTGHGKNFAATIELSLTSPLFRELGPDARAVLGVVAFFPQGVDENNIDWLFPTISNGTNILNKFCTLSLTYRSNGFITVLAPLRDYLSPKDPNLSPLLLLAKKSYFVRMSVYLDPTKPQFREARWITSEDVNVEHLLNIFTSIDADSDLVWDACANFMSHLSWHKPRLTALGPKIEKLHNCYHKPRCLFELSRLFGSIGNHMERKRLLTRAPGEWRSGYLAARAFENLSDVNRQMGRYKEGIKLAKEAGYIFEQLGDRVEQAGCLVDLAWLLYDDEQLDAAEEAAFRAIELEGGEKYLVCGSHCVLSYVYRSKGEREKAVHHLWEVLRIAYFLDWHSQLAATRCPLALPLVPTEGKSDTHGERAKAHAVDSADHPGRAMVTQAWNSYDQHVDGEVRDSVNLLQLFEEEVYKRFMNFDGELLETVLFPTPIDSPSSQTLGGTVSQT